MSKQYVQHISGQGQKWEVYSECGDFFRVVVPNRDTHKWDLPKSEYRLCEPPERWVDVTEECELKPKQFENHKGYSLFHDGEFVRCDGSCYRLRKIQINDPDREPDRWAFVVEKKVSDE